MTTPHQRTRSLLQTRAFLSSLVSGKSWPSVPREVKDEARRLLYHYPEWRHLSRLHEQIPEDWGAVAAVYDEGAGCRRDCQRRTRVQLRRPTSASSRRRESPW